MDPQVDAVCRPRQVAAANSLAVDAGVAMLARGGTAVDAAIAVQMMLTLVEPQSSGIGGGAFLLHYDSVTRALAAYDGRETAPAAATPGMFLNASGKPLEFTSAVDGGLSVGTPGILKLFEVVHARHGKLPWATLFEPAIALAERGFPISPRLHTLIAGTAERLCTQKAAAAFFLKAGTCQAKDAGTLLQNAELAGTLRTLASGGASAFYAGPIADAIVQTVRTHPTNPGLLTHADSRGLHGEGTHAALRRVQGLPPVRDAATQFGRPRRAADARDSAPLRCGDPDAELSGCGSSAVRSVSARVCRPCEVT